MTDQLTNRVSKMEIVQANQNNEIRQIHKKVGHIEQDMNDFKNISKINTDAINKTNGKLDKIILSMHEFKGGWRGVKIFGGLIATLIGLSLTILTINDILKNAS